MENNTAQMEARVQKLESLVARLSGGGGGGGFPFAGPVVANEAAAAAFSLSDTPGNTMQIFVLSHRSIWTKKNGVAGVQGVPPLAPHEVIAATAGPAGVLTRTTYSDPALRIGINDVFIDPANVLATHQNDGLTALTPLKTGYELHRRWGWSDAKPIVGCNLATSPDGFLNIHVQSDLVTPDSLPLKVTVARDVSLRIVSPLLAANILRTSTLTNAVTALNRAAPLGGTRLTVRDNTLANWAAFEVANRRVRMTTGPAVGGTFQPQTDTAATPGEVQCSACQTTNEPGFSQVPTTVTPAVGNTYVVEKLVVVNMGVVDIDEEFNTNGFDIFVNFVNINLPTTSSESWVPRAGNGVSGPALNFYQCTVDRNVDNSLAQVIFIACYGSQGVFGTGGKSAGPLAGGGWNGGIPGSGVQVALAGGTSIEAGLDFDIVFNLALIVAVTCPVKNAASWNAASTAGVNTGGHGFQIGGGGGAPFFGIRSAVQCKGTLWGNTARAGATGVLIGASCSGVGAPQNCTGPAADFKLANKIVGWWFNDATATYNPIGGSVATTWAALSAAEGAAGFGGNAHELDSNSHFVAVETTA